MSAESSMEVETTLETTHETTLETTVYKPSDESVLIFMEESIENKKVYHMDITVPASRLIYI